ncbi:Cytochrome c-type biogenesis protein CcmB [Cedecea neteri]|uniref:Heme exporter protein B n=1 Tax=Cedecea neteri TaxID=158822 RepID=A0A2X3KZP7_9ENTR|nr:Cytochrome c-type biogenesis protein CcmB [Cedecea neteri]
MIRRIFWRELQVVFRRGAEIANPLWFFLIVITLFPLGIGPEPQLLARIAPGIIWVAALLASLMAMDRLFRDDFQDGSLEQLMLLPVPLPLVVLAKVTAHWVVTGLPLLLLSPLAALLLGLDFLWLAGDGRHVTAGDADAELPRRARRGADGRAEAGRGAAQPAGAAVNHPAINFCHRRDGCRLDASAGGGLYGNSWRAAGRQRHAKPVRYGGGAAGQRCVTLFFVL